MRIFLQIKNIDFNDKYTDEAVKCWAVLMKMIGIWDLANDKNDMRKTINDES